MLLRPLFLSFLVFCALLSPSWATTVLPVSLENMIDDAAIAFEGTCLENRTVRDPDTNMIVTFTAFAVKDVLKGKVAATHTIKQIGGRLESEDLVYKIHGVPTFTVGAEYVVFLAGVSKIGFSSPIGLSQGQFSVRTNAKGKTVSNGRDFRVMAEKIAPEIIPESAAPVMHMELDDLKRVTRARVAANVSKP